jgi:diguanylate cyclase (GGDEF)-like protein
VAPIIVWRGTLAGELEYNVQGMKRPWWDTKRFKWAAIGGVLSFLGPLGEWIFVSLFAGQQENFLTLTYLYTEIWTLLCFTSFGFLLGRSNDELESIAFHDALTGVFSRGYLMAQFKELSALHSRYQQSFSAMMLDLDHFKQVNDRHGHLVGDKTLKAVAQCMKSTCRHSDIVGRYGGEEFLVLCPNTSQGEVLQLAERLRRNIARLPAATLGFDGPQTASLSVVAVADNVDVSSVKSIISSLDKALYAAKSKGRNQVQLALL